MTPPMARRLAVYWAGERRDATQPRYAVVARAEQASRLDGALREQYSIFRTHRSQDIAKPLDVLLIANNV